MFILKVKCRSSSEPRLIHSKKKTKRNPLKIDPIIQHFPQQNTKL